MKLIRPLLAALLACACAPALAATPNLGLVLPTVGADDDAWGTKINDALTALDAVFASSGTSVSLNVSTLNVTGSPLFTGGTFTIRSTGPDVRFEETDQTDPAGRFRIQVNGDSFKLQRATSSSWGSAADVFSVTGSSQVLDFAKRPTVAGELLLSAAANLSDLDSPSTARNSLGLAAVAASGSAADLGSGTLPAARLPNPSASTLGGVESIAAVSHQFLTSISTSGVPSLAQPAAADISGLATSATTDTTNASNIASGTLAAARGGAGTISGALKGNGSGTVSQAACADLSNGATGCSTATGTSGATIPLLNGTNTWSSAQTFSAAPTFSVAPIYTNQSATRTALGLGTAATANTGTSGTGVIPTFDQVGTWTGIQDFTTRVEVIGSAGTFRTVFLKSGTLARWGFFADNGTESGSNAGSDFTLNAYTDAGTSLGSAFTVTRSTQVLNFTKAPTFTDASTTRTNLGLATVASSGSAADLGSGTLPAARLPNPSASTLGGVESIASASHKFINTISTSGVPALAQPACGDLSDSVASCSTDTTSASNISSGTLAAARGGAGTISGALKGSGAGVVSQAACADLSNATTACSTSTGTSGATIPLLNGANTWSAAQTMAADVKTSGTAPTVSSCGTSPSVTSGSTDTAGEVVSGTTASGCTITFASSKANAPFCTVTDQSPSSGVSYSISTTAISVANVTNVQRIDYICVQH